MANTAFRRFGSFDARVYGPATIGGTVKVLTVPVAREVLLMEQDGLRVAKTTWSSATTGAYSFPNIKADREWLLLTFDPTGAYNAVVADRVTT